MKIVSFMYEVLKIPVDCKLFLFAYYLKDNRYF
jgi:hypothetical protein